MPNDPWWQGTDSTFSQEFLDFLLAVHGLNKAVRRIEADDDPHTAIECCWWIGAATEACGRIEEDSILAGFYWVRNKGVHRTAKAMGQILSAGPNELEPGIILTVPESRWRYLDGAENGKRKQYNKYLGGNSIADTIDDATAILLTIFDDVRTESGVSDLNL